MMPITGQADDMVACILKAAIAHRYPLLYEARASASTKEGVSRPLMWSPRLVYK